MAELPALELGINALEEDVGEAAALCRSEGLGLEVATFAFPAALDDGGLERRIAGHRDLVDGVPWVSVHGPFLDLFATSPDPAIVEVCERRHRAALGVARALGALRYVAHLNSLPQIRAPSYVDRFAERCVAFWRPLADEAADAGIVIVLENLWEPGPELQTRVVDEADHPALRASFDNGHALVFSPRPSAEWVQALGPRLAHVHLHDNDGDTDLHLPVGQGVEDWRPLVSALGRYAPDALVVLESDRPAENRRSLESLRGLGARPMRGA
jgi:sugar phosphate isomerase/epimerase